jgi:uncharacterized protein (DUF1684 family)
MKKILTLILLSQLCISCSSQGKRKITGNSDFQIEMNSKFKDASQSPLTKKGLKEFKGLDFFPINAKYKVVASLTKTNDEKIFNFPTTTSRIAKYQKYGVINFSIDGKEFELDIYKNPTPTPEYEDYLFLPFFDKTNGKTSYRGGRFVDITTKDEQEDGTIIVDFNKAYNPYCAYSDRYSCPITPRDNSLDIEIKAGVMAYKK